MIAKINHGVVTHRVPRHARRALAVLGLLLSVGFPVSELRAASDYLSAIEAAGDKLEPLGQAREEEQTLRRLQQQTQQTQQTQPAVARPVPVAAAKPAAASAAAATKAFEDQMRARFPGSFALYSLMDAKEKDSVYRAYQESKMEGTARFLPVVTRIITISTSKHSKAQ